MKPCVFIQTNDRQAVGARVAMYSLRRHSANADSFDVRIMHTREYPFFQKYEGRRFLRDGTFRVWRNDDLQSFTPLRFLPPQLMGYQGRAVVIDPDIFAAGDILELLSRDMQGHAIMCQRRPGHQGFDSSVMLLDCAKLTHWKCEEQFAEMFESRRDYYQWLHLMYEPPESIALFERCWNSLDRLEPETRLLHNTRRRTQPWKTGLPIEFTPGDKFRSIPPLHWTITAVRRVFKGFDFVGRYRRHPDPRQERFFFDLLGGALETGIVTEDFLAREIRAGHLRADALAMLGGSRLPPGAGTPLASTGR